MGTTPVQHNKTTMKLLFQVLAILLTASWGTCCKGGLTINFCFGCTNKYSSTSFQPSLNNQQPHQLIPAFNRATKNMSITIGKDENIVQILDNYKKNLNLADIGELDITVTPKEKKDGSAFKLHLDKDSTPKKKGDCGSSGRGLRVRRSSLSTSFASAVGSRPSLSQASLMGGIKTSVATSAIQLLERELPGEFLRDLCIEPVRPQFQVPANFDGLTVG